MANNEKPLPKPRNRPFGGKKQFEQEDEPGALLADRMAAAMAEGKLDDFLKEELSDNEYARSLAKMMMGMTGMLPAEGGPSSSTAPADVRKAIEGGDVKGLMELLRREHQKRKPGQEPAEEEKPAESRLADHPTIDKNVIDALIQIASENSVTTDWIVLRAIKFYVQEYQKTGRL